MINGASNHGYQNGNNERNGCEDQIVMTPKCKTLNSTILVIERKTVVHDGLKSEKMHFAGGDHTGIVINKQIDNILDDSDSHNLSIQFAVFLHNAQTGNHSEESRTLRFWFTISDIDQASVAQQFFRELVLPHEFPRDYVGFIKKIMKLLQYGYRDITKIEVELKQLNDMVEPPNRPISPDENGYNRNNLTEEKALEIIESSFPNPITIQDIQKNYLLENDEIIVILKKLETRGLIKSVENNAYTRLHSHNSETEIVNIVKQIPVLVSEKQPTIAIITAQYCEKLAVDSMIDNKETFVRFTTIGESNVYTLGNIGNHRVVSTKLPTVGHTREAMTAAGNTTTRLLGTFQKVDYIFLVGVAGGVPHYTDYNRHVRLGDVVISCPNSIKKPDVYLYCTHLNKVRIDDRNETNNENGILGGDKEATFDDYNFEIKSYSPINSYLQEIAKIVKQKFDSNDEEFLNSCKHYLDDGLSGLKRLHNEHDFSVPPEESDKLFMAIGEKAIIQVSHPNPKSSYLINKIEGLPRLHLTPIASGRIVSKNDQIRQLFASKRNIFAFDCEFDAVIESILGNCRDSFICIRGIADYKDGTRGKEWQPYASLAAATVMKAIITFMDSNF